jgi:hypothetical protein
MSSRRLADVGFILAAGVRDVLFLPRLNHTATSALAERRQPNRSTRNSITVRNIAVGRRFGA